MDGVLFYWFSWIGLVYTTFMMNKNHQDRFRLSVGLFLLIISSPYKISIMGIEFSLAAVVLVSYFIMYTANLRAKEFASVFLSSFIIMLAYVSFLLFALFDPVWVIFDPKWMIAIGGMLLASILQEKARSKSVILVSGMLLGEFVFSVLMNRLSFQYPVASLAFLDITALAFMVVVIWSAINYLAQTVSHYYYQGRGKQKTS